MEMQSIQIVSYSQSMKKESVKNRNLFSRLPPNRSQILFVLVSCYLCLVFGSNVMAIVHLFFCLSVKSLKTTHSTRCFTTCLQYILAHNFTFLLANPSPLFSAFLRLMSFQLLVFRLPFLVLTSWNGSNETITLVSAIMLLLSCSFARILKLLE